MTQNGGRDIRLWTELVIGLVILVGFTLFAVYVSWWILPVVCGAAAVFSLVDSRNLRRKGHAESAKLRTTVAAILLAFAAVWVLIILL